MLGGVDDYGVVFEGEGCDCLINVWVFRRVMLWFLRGGYDDGEEVESLGGLRVGYYFRRFLVFGGGGGGVSDGDVISFRRFFFGIEWVSMFSV